MMYTSVILWSHFYAAHNTLDLIQKEMSIYANYYYYRIDRSFVVVAMLKTQILSWSPARIAMSSAVYMAKVTRSLAESN